MLIWVLQSSHCFKIRLAQHCGRRGANVSENEGVRSECKKFGENSRQMAPVSTICDEYCRTIKPCILTFSLLNSTHSESGKIAKNIYSRYANLSWTILMILIFTYFDFSQSLLYILFCFENSLTVLLHSLSILFLSKVWSVIKLTKNINEKIHAFH